MVKALVVNHDLGWLAPGPMWGAFGDLADDDNRRRFVQPAILRFANDAFMEELMGALAFHPEKVAEWKARWESWEEPMTNPPTAANLPLSEPVSRRAVQLVRGPILSGRMRPAQALVPASLAPTAARPLKLYQPVQNRFYLVSASLVCQQPGLPDRHVNPGKQEQVGFVLRRRIAPNTGGGTDPLSWDEYAYVQTAHGPRWQKAADGNARAATLLPGEERLPMFSLGYTDSGNNNRRIFSGLIPVGRREVYVGAALVSESDASAANGAAVEDVGPDTRELLFALQVTGPWHELIEHADMRKAKYAGWPLGVDLANVGNSTMLLKSDILSARQRAQTISWYVILDFVRFLYTHAPRVLGAIVSPAARSGLNNVEEALIAYLETIALQPAYKTKLRNDLSLTAYHTATIVDNLKLAMAEIARDAALQEKLERAESTFEYAISPDWPRFLFPLADPDPAHGPFPFSGVTMNIEDFFKTLTSRVVAALPGRSQAPQPDINIPKEMPLAGADAWFTIRCVYECPNCGPLKPPLLSAPTEVFEMASFFDPEAPTRQIRIPMPFNISPAALRRYNKSATLVVSDMLCGQIKRIRKLSLGDLVLSVLPWPFHKDLPSVGPSGPCSDGTGTFGMFCSLSIPIVTLCALILLLIIVALFDLFFRWIPLLFVCFPIPKLGPKR